MPEYKFYLTFIVLDKRQIEIYRFVTEGHLIDFFIHILEHGHCLNILVIGYKEFHSPFQTSIVIIYIINIRIKVL